MGYRACQEAFVDNLADGCVGAGIGATVGKIKGIESATKSGLGIAHTKLGELEIGAIVVVNALGEVYNPENGEILAGVRDQSGFVRTDEILKHNYRVNPFSNTTIGVVYTNAKLSKAEATKLAQVSHQGLVRTIRPIHTKFDGDTIFALSVGEIQADSVLLGMLTADLVSQAIVRAVQNSTSLGGLPAITDLKW